jgi:hypothetical protein
MPTPPIRVKTSAAIRMRSVVEQALAEHAIPSIIERAPDTPWLATALAEGAIISVIGGAWLHSGPNALWPGAVARVTHVERGRVRTVIVWPTNRNDEGVLWSVRTLTTGDVNQDQLWPQSSGQMDASPPPPPPQSTASSS